jgi:hypothetical protein
MRVSGLPVLAEDAVALAGALGAELPKKPRKFTARNTTTRAARIRSL